MQHLSAFDLDFLAVLESQIEVINCRAAKLTDEDDVAEISKNIYGQADITMYMFKEWLKADNWLLYVAEGTSSGKVIGFLALNITDDETRVTVRSARVAEAKRGMRVYTKLLDYALLHSKTISTRIQSVINVKRMELKVPTNYTVRETFNLVAIRLFLEQGTTQLFDEKIRWDGQIQSRKFCDLYENQSGFREIFPHNNIFINFNLHCTSLQNSRIYLDEHKDVKFFYSTRILLHEFTGTLKHALSVIGPLPEKNTTDKFFTSVDLYGNDFDMFRCHVIKSIEIVSTAAMQHGKTSMVVKFCLHVEERHELAKFIAGGKNFEVSEDLELNIMEVNVKRHPYQYSFSDIPVEE